LPKNNLGKFPSIFLSIFPSFFKYRKIYKYPCLKIEMKKIEHVFREILFQAIENKKTRLTQSELSKKLNLSLSIVNLAANKIAEIGAVIIEPRGFRVIDIKKILYYWASVRNLQRDIVYKTRVEIPVRDIEKNLPDVFYSCFSAYKFKFNDVPADYSEVYVYADNEIEAVKKRFPEKKENPNLFILKSDKNMKLYGKTLTIGQIFVDLWNLNTWYAKDFLTALEKKMSLVEK